MLSICILYVRYHVEVNVNLESYVRYLNSIFEIHGEVNFNLDEYAGHVEVVTLTPTRNWTKSLNNGSD